MMKRMVKVREELSEQMTENHFLSQQQTASDRLDHTQKYQNFDCSGIDC
jgi:hypothetical protein